MRPASLLLCALLAAAARKGRLPVKSADDQNSVTMTYVNSSMTCGLFRLGSVPGGKLWYDNNDFCPGPVSAELLISESGTTPFAFQVNITDDAPPNTSSQVTLQSLEGNGVWVSLHLNLSVDGQSYTPGSAVYPLHGMTARLRITPTVFSSSSAGCYSYGSSSTPPNQTSCGHALVAPTPGAPSGTTGQASGHYQGSASVIVYL